MAGNPEIKKGTKALMNAGGECNNMRQLLMGFVRSAYLLVLLTFSGQTIAFAQSRWIEFDYNDSTITYDLTTVQMLDPGRFTIMSNSQDHPDVIRFRLAVLKTLKSYCGRPDGEYPPPSKLFTLGSPDMPIENIKVKTRSRSKPFKNAVWSDPYRKLAIGTEEGVEFFDCKGPAVQSVDKEYDDLKSLIMNGIASKELYDCRHGIAGLFANTNDPLSKAITTTNIRGAYLSAYLRLCPAIVGGLPYIPNK